MEVAEKQEERKRVPLFVGTLRELPLFQCSLLVPPCYCWFSSAVLFLSIPFSRGDLVLRRGVVNMPVLSYISWHTVPEHDDHDDGDMMMMMILQNTTSALYTALHYKHVQRKDY